MRLQSVIAVTVIGSLIACSGSSVDGISIADVDATVQASTRQLNEAVVSTFESFQAQIEELKNLAETSTKEPAATPTLFPPTSIPSPTSIPTATPEPTATAPAVVRPTPVPEVIGFLPIAKSTPTGQASEELDYLVSIETLLERTSNNFVAESDLWSEAFQRTHILGVWKEQMKTVQEDWGDLLTRWSRMVPPGRFIESHTSRTSVYVTKLKNSRPILSWLEDIWLEQTTSLSARPVFDDATRDLDDLDDQIAFADFLLEDALATHDYVILIDGMPGARFTGIYILVLSDGSATTTSFEGKVPDTISLAGNSLTASVTLNQEFGQISVEITKNGASAILNETTVGFGLVSVSD